MPWKQPEAGAAPGAAMAAGKAPGAESLAAAAGSTAVRRFEDLIRKGQDRVKNIMPGGFGSPRSILVLLGVVVWLLSGLWYSQENVSADSYSVVM